MFGAYLSIHGMSTVRHVLRVRTGRHPFDLGYGRKSNFRGGTTNLSIKSERVKVGTVMFHLGIKESNGTKFVKTRCFNFKVILKKTQVPIIF